MYSIITDTRRTNRESAVYAALKSYTFTQLPEMPRIVEVPGDQEPYGSVADMLDDALRTARLKVWGHHFEAPHKFLTQSEYGTYRAVHDWFGHAKTVIDSKGRKGQFDLIGEYQALEPIARHGSVDLVEAVILETIQRNQQPDAVFYPWTSPSTYRLAQMAVNRWGR